MGAAAALVVGAGGLVAVAAVPATAGVPAVAATHSTKVTTSTAHVKRWIDGDTLELTNGKRVRLIGVDTPEVGKPGAAHATKVARKYAKGTVTLVNPSSVTNTDRYGRLLRYVRDHGRDVGALQIKAGAKARYDGTDGYQWHPKQAKYHALDKAHKNYPTKAGSSSGGAYSPSGPYTCPKSAPIKGNESSHIYHLPGQRYYDATKPEVCFKTESAARAHGYRASKV